MPRDGSNVYSAPASATAVPGDTIASASHNALVADLVADLNAARPISAGGTGATSASAARTALGVAASSHTHAISDVTGLQADLDAIDTGKADASHTHTASEITDFSEAVDDRVGALVVAGDGINVTYNDGAGTLTIDNTVTNSDTQILNSTGTWTAPAWVTATTRSFIQIWSGGASGNTHSGGGEGAGGGGGGYVEFWVLTSTLGATATATVGAGGAAGTNGNDGGSSTFAGITVTGGKKPASQTTADVGGGLSGIASGSIFAGGAVGSAGTYGGGPGGSYGTAGGASVYGAGGGGGRTAGSGGTSVFGGAGGAPSVAGTAPGGGGGWNAAGAAGRIIVTTFL